MKPRRTWWVVIGSRVRAFRVVASDRAPWIVAALVVALGTVRLAAALAVASAEASVVLVAFLGSLWPIVFAIVGGIVASRARNVVGWLLLLIGSAGVVLQTAGVYAEVADIRGMPAGPSAVIEDLAWTTTFPLIFLLLQLYPDGRPVSRRWRPLVALTIAWPVALTTVLRLSPVSLTGGEPVPNPDGIQGPVGDAIVLLIPVLLGAFVALIAASIVAALQRLRRARGVERQQLKWFAYSATGVVASFVASEFFAPEWVDAVTAVVLSLLPISIGVAVTRHRLYDIDVLINRTLVYGALTATLGATYVGSVLLLQTVLRPLTADNEIAVAVSTLAVVALFQPMRRRVQDAVDRRFYRSRYDAQRTLDAFAGRLRDQVDLDELGSELVGVVADTVQPAHASLWLRQR